MSPRSDTEMSEAPVVGLTTYRQEAAWGVWHTRADVLPTVALALFAGLRGPAHARVVLFGLPVAWFVGGMAGLSWPAPAAVRSWTWLSFLMLGGIVALDVPVPKWAAAAIAAGAGLFHGWLDGAEIHDPGTGPLSLIGIVAVIFPLVALVSAWITSIRSRPARIAVRVAGSWIAATGLLLLGWSLKPGVG